MFLHSPCWFLVKNAAGHLLCIYLNLLSALGSCLSKDLFICSQAPVPVIYVQLLIPRYGLCCFSMVLLRMPIFISQRAEKKMNGNLHSVLLYSDSGAPLLAKYIDQYLQMAEKLSNIPVWQRLIVASTVEYKQL